MLVINKLKSSIFQSVNELLPEKILVRIKHEGFRKYFTNTGWPIVAQVINILVTFFVSAYTIRYLGPERFGTISFSLSFVGLFSFFASLIVDGIIYRELLKQPKELNKILGTGILVKFASSIFTVGLIAIMIILFQGNDYTTILITLIIAFSLLFQPFGIISFYFQSRVMNKVTSFISVLVLFSLALLKVIFVLLNFGIYWFALIFLLEPIFFGIGYLFFYFKFEKSILNWRFDYVLAKQMVGDSWPLLMSAVFATISGRIDQVFLGKIFDKHAVGLYATMVKLSEAWFFLPGIIAGSLFPAVVNAKVASSELFEKRLIKLYALIFWLAVAATSVMFCLSGFLINILFGPEFLPVVGPMRIYVFCGIIVALSIIINQWLLIENYTKIALFCSAFGGVSNILLNIYFIPRQGIMGAVISSLISYSLSILAILFFKKTRRHWLTILRGITFNF